MSKLVAVRIKQNDGSYSNEIPIGALTQDITYNINNTNYSLRQILGQVEIANNSKGSIQHQLNELFLKFATYIPETVAKEVDDALESYAWGSGATTIIDGTLSLTNEHAVAQAAAVQKVIIYGDERDPNIVAGTQLLIDPITLSNEITVLTTDDNVAYTDMITINLQNGNVDNGTARASQNYAVGEYIAINTELYKTITAINSNEVFVVNNNIEKVRLTDQIKINANNIAESAVQIAKNESDIADLQEQIKNASKGSETINLNDYEDEIVPYTISDGNLVTRATVGYNSYQIKREPFWAILNITAQNDSGAYVLMLKEHLDPSLSSNTDITSYLADGWSGRRRIDQDSTTEIILPDDCANIFIFKTLNSVDVVPTDLVSCTIMKDELSLLRNDINVAEKSAESVLEQLTGSKGLIWKSGRYVTSTNTPSIGCDVVYDPANKSFVCAVSPCVQGDIFTASLKGYTGNNRGYIVCDSFMKALSWADNNVSINGEITVEDDDAAYIVFTNRLSQKPDGYYAYKGHAAEEDLDTLSHTVNNMLFIDADFPVKFENGTYRQITVGSVLEKYYTSPYDKTRKVLDSVSFVSPCDISIIAKTGYAFVVYRVNDENEIISKTDDITDYTFSRGSRCGIVLKATNGTDDISAVDVFDIISIINRENDARLEPMCPFIEEKKIDPSTGEATSSTYYAATDYVYCKGFDFIEYTRYHSSNLEAQTTIGMAFYNKNHEYISGEPFGSIESGKDVKLRLVKIPDNAHYARFSYPVQNNIVVMKIRDFDAVLIKTGSIYSRFGQTDGMDTSLPDLYPYKPHSEGVANAIKTAHKMSGVKWTPVDDIPRMFYTLEHDYTTSKFLKDVEYKGVPYSHSMNRQNIIGIEVSLDRFMSAVATPGSILYANLIQNRSYFGTVCSAFVAGVFGLKGEENTYTITTVDGMELIAPKGAFDEYTFELCDICVESTYHVLMITGILTDKDGVIKLIEVSEAGLYGLNAGGKVISKWWEPSNFFEKKLGNRNYKLYRYKYIDQVKYYASDFSQVFPEPQSRKKVNPYCCPFAGEGAVSTTAETEVPILISENAFQDDFVKMTIYKNGTKTEDVPITAETETVSVDCTSSGRYMAYLSKESGVKSPPCHWTVYSVSVSAQVNDTALTVTYDTDGVIYTVNYTYDGKPYSIPCELTGSGQEEFVIPSGATPTDVTLGNPSSLIHVEF